MIDIAIYIVFFMIVITETIVLRHKNRRIKIQDKTINDLSDKISILKEKNKILEFNYDKTKSAFLRLIKKNNMLNKEYKKLENLLTSTRKR